MAAALKLGKLIARGSNKEVYDVSGDSSLVAFKFSDRVSVFDYGAIPELIPERGTNLMRFALAMQNLLLEHDIPSAFEPGVSATLQSFVMKKASGAKWNLLKKRGDLAFVPLEVVFRWGVPRGSSLLKRDPQLQVGQKFSEARIEFYTKLEDQDRLLSATEAQKILGKDLKLAELTSFATGISAVLKKYFDLMNLTLWDGKIEVATKTDGSFVLVDAITPDELRLTMPGKDSVPLSKELLRFWLSKTLWAFEVDQAKAKGAKNWKADVPTPPRLGIWRIERISKLYQALADAVHKEESSAIVSWLRGEEILPKVHVMGARGREAAISRRLKLEGVSLVDDPSRADCVFVSTDSDLANGKVNELLASGQWCFGPTREASRVEWSKEFGREIAKEAGIPIPRFEVVEDPDKLDQIVDRFGAEFPVVKFDGLAAGKGVVVPNSRPEMMTAAKKWLMQGRVLLEERLKGFEASVFFAVNSCREIDVTFLGSAQDFKRRFLGDEGPNTGGMGAYAPHPKLSAADISVFQGWAQKTAEVLKARKKPFNGVLYLGIMKDEKKGWQLIEYNARLGDPETQALVALWSPEKPILRHLLQLDVQADSPMFIDNDAKALCLALVRKEYPEPADPIDFPVWSSDSVEKGDAQTVLFENEQKTGRVAYLVSKDADLLVAGDRLFQVLLESPWKDLVEWRSDILK